MTDLSCISINEAFNYFSRFYYNGSTSSLENLNYPSKLLNYYQSARDHLLYNVILTSDFESICDSRNINDYVPASKRGDGLCDFLIERRILVLVVNLACDFRRMENYREIIRWYGVNSSYNMNHMVDYFKKKITRYSVNVLFEKDFLNCNIVRNFFSKSIS